MNRTLLHLPGMSAVVLLASLGPTAANEKLGFAVRRLTDACVGTMLMKPAVMEVVAKAGRTATGICTCAAEVEIATGVAPKEGFDFWVIQPRFKSFLERCSLSGSH